MPTQVVRGRADTVAADRQAVADLLAHTAETGERGVRAWRPHRHLAFGPRDTREPGYDRAREAAADRGFPAIERSVGGRAVAYTGRTVSFAVTLPIADQRTGLTARYDDATATLRRAFRTLGADTDPGEPPRSFCPGGHSLQRNGKVAGVAQRVTQEAALVAGVAVTDFADAIDLVDVVEPVYDALAVPFDASSVGHLGNDPDAVAEAVEAAFVDGDDVSVREL